MSRFEAPHTLLLAAKGMSRRPCLRVVRSDEKGGFDLLHTSSRRRATVTRGGAALVTVIATAALIMGLLGHRSYASDERPPSYVVPPPSQMRLSEGSLVTLLGPDAQVSVLDLGPEEVVASLDSGPVRVDIAPLPGGHAATPAPSSSKRWVPFSVAPAERVEASVRRGTHAKGPTDPRSTPPRRAVSPPGHAGATRVTGTRGTENGPPVRGNQLLIEAIRVFGHALLRSVIDVHEAEPLLVAVSPLEIVE